MSKLAAYRRSPIALIVLLFLGLTFTGTAYAALQPTAPADNATASATTGDDVEEGRKLFLTNCASCHGTNAEGKTGVRTTGPSLIGVGSAAVDFQVGTGRMPMATPGVQAADKPVVFTDKEIDQLGAFIDSLGPGPGVPDAQFTDLVNADIANGGMLFRTNCAMCHNSSAQGGALTRGKYAPSLMGVESKHIYEAMLTGPQSMPVFNDATLTPQEKEDVIAFIKNIEEGGNDFGGHSLGSMGPAGDALFIWTIGIGLLIAASVWLGRKAA